ncbi:MAG: hypothetical protein COA42_07825 [Alteromonadaceae bacterium]|nr:MAG: hypothetical protein COA42_07825 [Alteromonadaceae bacterium]
MAALQLAQINIAEALNEREGETMRNFVARIEGINVQADQAPGFIWRIEEEDGSEAPTIQSFANPLMLINMSVWEDIDGLKQFVCESRHMEPLRDKTSWFGKVATMHQALWWVPKGHTPRMSEGKVRLDYLQKHGSSQYAFTFEQPYTAEESTRIQIK